MMSFVINANKYVTKVCVTWVKKESDTNGKKCGGGEEKKHW